MFIILRQLLYTTITICILTDKRYYFQPPPPVLFQSVFRILKLEHLCVFKNLLFWIVVVYFFRYWVRLLLLHSLISLIISIYLLIFSKRINISCKFSKVLAPGSTSQLFKDVHYGKIVLISYLLVSIYQNPREKILSILKSLFSLKSICLSFLDLFKKILKMLVFPIHHVYDHPVEFKYILCSVLLPAPTYSINVYYWNGEWHLNSFDKFIYEALISRKRLPVNVIDFLFLNLNSFDLFDKNTPYMIYHLTNGPGKKHLHFTHNSIFKDDSFTAYITDCKTATKLKYYGNVPLVKSIFTTKPSCILMSQSVFTPHLSNYSVSIHTGQVLLTTDVHLNSLEILDNDFVNKVVKSNDELALVSSFASKQFGIPELVISEEIRNALKYNKY